MYSLEIPLDFSQTVKKERDNQSEKIDADYTEPQSADKPYLEGHVEKNVYEDLNNIETDGKPTGYAANLTSDDERELLEQLKNNSVADIGIADKILNDSRILEELIKNDAQKNSQSPKQSASQTESEKEKLFQQIKRNNSVKVSDTSKYSTEQLIKDTLMYHGALHDFCYPSDISSFVSSEEIFSGISDINKNRYYTPPKKEEKSKPKHGRYLNSAHEEEIERVVSKIFDSVARDLGI